MVTSNGIFSLTSISVGDTGCAIFKLNNSGPGDTTCSENMNGVESRSIACCPPDLSSTIGEACNAPRSQAHNFRYLLLISSPPASKPGARSEPRARCCVPRQTGRLPPTSSPRFPQMPLHSHHKEELPQANTRARCRVNLHYPPSEEEQPWRQC